MYDNSFFILAKTLHNYSEDIVNTCIDVYDQITQQLLPTPAKSHYTFNLRDLAKVFQGMLMGDPNKVTVSVKRLFCGVPFRTLYGSSVNCLQKLAYKHFSFTKRKKIFFFFKHTNIVRSIQ